MRSITNLEAHASRLPDLNADETELRWNRSEAIAAVRQLEVIRRIEEWLVANEGLVHGPLHSSIGQEAVAVGSALSLGDGDCITATHRAHHHVLAMQLRALSQREDSLASPPPEPILRTLAEILGLRTGLCGGRGGSMHLSDPRSGVLATSAIVGGGLPIATGAAFTMKHLQRDAVAVAFVGDGGVSIGAFHESLNLARVLELPVIFVIENNLYSVATTLSETAGFEDLALRARGYDMPGLIVDGMNPMSVHQAMKKARAYALEFGPVLIEAKTYRYLHQSGSKAGSVFGYRTDDEEKSWRDRDPLINLPTTLIRQGLLSAEDVDRARMWASEVVEGVVDLCTRETPGGRQARSELSPDPETALEGVVSELEELTDIAWPPVAGAGPTQSTRFVTAVSKVTAAAMERDHTVYVIGEDSGHLRGGAYGTTRDACQRFPERVISSPISENGFSGLALGSALTGLRPVVEIMFPDFTFEGADQLFNHIPKIRHMFGGATDVPVVVRMRTAQGRGFGPQHSSDPSAWFAQHPGWRVCAPSSPSEYIGLFNAAIRGQDPVLIVEHHGLWEDTEDISDSLYDLALPIGVGRKLRSGTDLTVVSWSHALQRCANALDSFSPGLSADLIDPRWLDSNSLDLDLILTSVRRSGRLVIVEDAMSCGSVGPHIAARVYEKAFDNLLGPIELVSGANVPAPVASPLESAVHLKDSQIVSAIKRTMSI